MQKSPVINWFLYLFISGWLTFTFSQGTVNLPQELADADATVEPVYTGLAYSEGPAFNDNGNLYFSEDPDYLDGRIWKLTPDGETTVFFEPGNSSNGLEFDPQGRLVSCQQDRVLRFEEDSTTTALVESGNGMDLQKVNDLSIGSSGAMYFTNLWGGTVFFRNEEGEVKQFSQFNNPNGIEWIEEKSFIYLAANGRLLKCAVDASNGDIGNCEDFAGVNGPDGLTVDENGNVYQASWSDGAIVVFDSTGNNLGRIEINAEETQGKHFTQGQSGNASNCVFGGPENRTLYITGDDGCYRVQLKVAGRKKPVAGCMDSVASNFNSEASIDDSSCEYRGCTNPEAVNYDSNALEDDGSCVAVDKHGIKGISSRLHLSVTVKASGSVAFNVRLSTRSSYSLRIFRIDGCQIWKYEDRNDLKLLQLTQEAPSMDREGIYLVLLKQGKDSALKIFLK
jgi:gluconolactonase